MFRIGYNTNGFAHHRLPDALEVLAELGYEAVSITPDVHGLDPLHLDLDEVARVRACAEALGLALSVETGARYVLDPRRKHFPTLMEDAVEDRARRVAFLLDCVDLTAELGGEVVSLWAGAAPGGAVGDRREGPAAPEVLWERLAEGLRPVLERGEAQGVQVAFEPEPGMFLERPAGYLELCERMGSDADALGLCLDVGHLLCTGDLPVAEVIGAMAPRLVVCHLDDIAGGVHDHRMFGEGDLDLPATLRALVEVGFEGIAAVELSRDSHRAPLAAREAIEKLHAALGQPPA